MTDTSNEVFCCEELWEDTAIAILNAALNKHALTLQAIDPIITHDILTTCKPKSNKASKGKRADLRNTKNGK
eukprot:2120438-Ditylum_brightwellii.AAC.1